MLRHILAAALALQLCGAYLAPALLPTRPRARAAASPQRGLGGPLPPPKFGLGGPTGLRMTAATPAAVRWGDADVQRKKAAAGEAEAVKGVGVGKIAKALKKPKGTLCIGAEIKRKDPSDPKFPEMGPIEECAVGFHNAKVAVLAVWMDEEVYGMKAKELAEVVESQKQFKGNFPGPTPVIACDIYMGKSTIATAAQAGASGVLMSARSHGEDLGGMVGFAHECGVDAVVLCEDQAGVEAAGAAGADVVAIDTKVLGLDGAIALRASAGETPTMALGGLKELTDVWKLRDAGFQCAMFGGELMATAYGREGEVRQGGGKEGVGASLVQSGGLFRSNDANTFVKACTAKASSKYGPSSVTAFKERGAKFKKHYEV